MFREYWYDDVLGRWFESEDDYKFFIEFCVPVGLWTSWEMFLGVDTPII